MSGVNLANWWAASPRIEIIWVIIGFVAQFLFSMRFIMQWLATEKARASIVPEAFWYYSLGGGALLLAYAIYRMDPVFLLGQAMGLLIFVRNIHFIKLIKREARPVHI